MSRPILVGIGLSAALLLALRTNLDYPVVVVTPDDLKVQVDIREKVLEDLMYFVLPDQLQLKKLDTDLYVTNKQDFSSGREDRAMRYVCLHATANQMPNGDFWDLAVTI